MANISVYDSSTGLTKNVTVDIASATINGEDTGSAQFYVTVSTTTRTPNGSPIIPIVITDFVDGFTTEIKAAIIVLFELMTGKDESSESESSSVSTESQSSQSPVLSSQSSSSVSSVSSLTSISSKSGV